MMDPASTPDPDDTNTIPQEVIEDWLKAKRIIATMLRELRPDMSEKHIDHNAAAMIARLSHANMTIDTIREPL